MFKFIILDKTFVKTNFRKSDKFIDMVSMQTFYTALADRTRRRILNLIREQEICVCFLTEVLEISQPKISRHLAYLRNAEIVSARREGKWMYYSIVEPEDFYAAQILHGTLDWLKSQERMQKDYERLTLICNSPDVPVNITRASKPVILPNPDIYYESKKELDTFLL
jgi:ArsR family transcriptional regulator